MQKHHVATLSLISLFFAGCQATPTVDTEVEAGRIMALQSEWSSRFGDGDIEWIMDLHASDARQFPPEAPPVVGHEALRAQWQGMIENVDAAWISDHAGVAESGDLAYDFGTATIQTPDGPVPATYVVVWVRENGQWKVAVDMFSPDQPD